MITTEIWEITVTRFKNKQATDCRKEGGTEFKVDINIGTFK